VSFGNADTSPGVFWGALVFDKVVANKPDASADFETDWMYLTEFGPADSLSAVTFGTSVLTSTSVDLRAKRRLPQLSDGYFLVLKNASSGNIAVTTFNRVLLGLH
jgi:hypothetical protein